MPLITHTVTEKHVSKRLDMYIAHYEPHISRNRIQTLIKTGLALVDGKREKPGAKVKPGDAVFVRRELGLVHAGLVVFMPALGQLNFGSAKRFAV